MSPGEAVEYALSEPDAPSAGTFMSGNYTVVRRRLVLTRRKEAVAALVARGLTNRRIASELSISKHTAANHVAKILRKLDFRSRAQLSAWTTEQGASPETGWPPLPR